MDKEFIQFDNVALDDNNVETNKLYTYNLRDKFKASLVKRDITIDIIPDPKIEKHVKMYDDKMFEAMKRVIINFFHSISN